MSDRTYVRSDIPCMVGICTVFSDLAPKPHRTSRTDPTVQHHTMYGEVQGRWSKRGSYSQSSRRSNMATLKKSPYTAFFNKFTLGFTLKSPLSEHFHLNLWPCSEFVIRFCSKWKANSQNLTLSLSSYQKISRGTVFFILGTVLWNLPIFALITLQRPVFSLDFHARFLIKRAEYGLFSM